MNYKYVNDKICDNNKRLVRFNEYGVNFFVDNNFYYDGNFLIHKELDIELDLTQMDYLEDDKWGPYYINSNYILIIGDYLGIIGLGTINNLYSSYHGI